MWNIHQEVCGVEQLCVSALLSVGGSAGSPKPDWRITSASRCPVGRSWMRFKGGGSGKPWLGNHSYQKQTCVPVLNLSAVPAGPLQRNCGVHPRKVSTVDTEKQRQCQPLCNTQTNFPDSQFFRMENLTRRKEVAIDTLRVNLV